MKPFHSRLLILSLMSLGFASLAFASDSTVPIEYLRPMKNSVSVGVRLIGGASVTFGGPGLGVIPGDRAAISADGSSIVYDDGVVYLNDSTAASSSGNRPDQSQIPATNGRWQTYTTLSSTTTPNSITVINGNFLPYDNNNNTTRNWNASSAKQIYTDPATGLDYVDMSTYASNGADGEVHAKSTATPGFELQLGRVMQRFRHFEWGFNLTFGISEFNAKTSQTLTAQAIKYTDRYQVYQYDQASGGLVPGNIYNGSSLVDANGNPATIQSSDETVVTSGSSTGKMISGPAFVDMAYTDADGNQTSDGTSTGTPNVFSGGYEVTTPIGIAGLGDSGGSDPSYAPQQYDAQTADGGLINGYWQVKGVYYLARLGPMIRIPIGNHYAASFSAGYIAAWVGSTMRFSESLVIPGITTKSLSLPDPTTPIIATTNGYQYNMTTDIIKNNQRYLSGMYFDANFEWWVTTRTGFYVGAVIEKLSSYKQECYSRVATIKMDDGLGLHFGIITRF